MLGIEEQQHLEQQEATPVHSECIYDNQVFIFPLLSLPGLSAFGAFVEGDRRGKNTEVSPEQGGHFISALILKHQGTSQKVPEGRSTVTFNWFIAHSTFGGNTNVERSCNRRMNPITYALEKVELK